MSKPPSYRGPKARIRKLDKPTPTKDEVKRSLPIGIGRAVDYLLEEHGVAVSRQTVYNWSVKGKRGTMLKTITKAGRIYTTRENVDAFVAALG